MSIFSSGGGGLAIPDNITFGPNLAAAPINARDNDSYWVTTTGLAPTSLSEVIAQYKWNAETGQWVQELTDTDISAVNAALAGTNLTVSVTEDGVTLSDTVDLAAIDTNVSAVTLSYNPVTGALTASVTEDGNTVTSAPVTIDTDTDVSGVAIDDTTNPGQIAVVVTEDGVDVTSNYVSIGGGHWNEAGTLTASTANANSIYTQNYVGINGPANMTPKSPAHWDRNVSNAANAFVANPPSDGFDDYAEYQSLYYDSNTPQNSYGIGIESGTLAYNSGDRHLWRRRGAPIFGSDDGYIRSFDYGKNTKNNGTPTHVLVVDANGYHRERAITDGNPRMAQPLWGGNWLFGGWSAVQTGNTYQDRGWATAYTFTAPQLYAGATGANMDLVLNGHMGREIIYARECRVRAIIGWRLLVNGAVVGTREVVDEYEEFRTNLGNESILDYRQRHAANSWNWVRNNVPPGATCEIQHRVRFWVQGAQTNAYARVIHGYGRECTALFTSRQGIIF